MADPLIHEIPTTVTSFASDDYIVLDGVTNGTRNMTQANLKNSVVAGNIAPLFDPNRTSSDAYAIGDDVIYDGEWYSFTASHYGAWNSSHATRNGSYSDYVNHLASASSLASTDVITVTNTTDGKTRKMSKDDLMTETAQATLAGNLAPEYVAATGAVAGTLYMHDGEMYLAKVDVPANTDFNRSSFIKVNGTAFSALANNLFVKFIIDSAFIRTNGVYTSYAGFSCTDYIPCIPGEILITNCAIEASDVIAASAVFFDSDKNFISYSRNTNSSALSKINIPSNASFVRFSINNSLFTTNPVFIGDFIDKKRADLGSRYVYDEFPLILNERIFRQNVKFNDGKFVYVATGSVESDAGHSASDRFKVIPDSTIYMNATATGNAVAAVAFYDVNGDFISSVQNLGAGHFTKRIIVPSTAVYARFSCSKDKVSSSFFRGDFYKPENMTPLYNLEGDISNLSASIEGIGERVSILEGDSSLIPLQEMDVNHVITIGQSLSVMGGNTNSVHTDINSYKLSDGISIPITTSVSGSTLTAISSPYAPNSEYPVISENEFICKTRKLGDGQTLASYGFATIMTAWGSGGIGISTIISNFAKFKTIVDTSKNLVNDLGLSYILPVINWIQGEYDCKCTEAQASTYCSSLLTFFSSLQDYVATTTGNPKPKLVTYQLSTYEGYNNSNKRMTLPVAMLGFCMDNDREIALGAVTYQLPYNDDHLHLTSLGSRMLGSLMGAAFNEFAYNGTKRPYIYLKSHSVQNYGSKWIIILEFSVPYGPLVFDHNSPIDGNALKFYDHEGYEVTVSNEGFELMNSSWNYNGTEGSGAMTSPVVENWSTQNIITSVSIKRGNFVEIVCSADPTGMELWYARRGNQGGGFLRDSRGDSLTVNINQRTCRLDNYCPLFMITV